ncbi:phage tail tape measure protein [Streptomyces ipomoeae]|uniref:phage tail tape measure protein n=1 Tax=Streptomyces ipomoeae TaxID=103232 RepID=UPI0029A36290|nr:phage tail tape measure protein [Streptomyces ipomoeae]MDX2694946.1 transglycosylase SLT domain-containing protein [Streptomyces ipomoeae]MDX2840843.1 transglycosylase SLT domain-containing protein [Streptomyces ipomoeae]
MPNVGYATLQIIPSVRGIADELRSQLVGPAEDAGQDAGQAAGGSLKEKILVGAAAAGVAAGAVLVAGITEAMEQANITSTLQAQLGATSKDAAKYGKIAGQLYAKGIVEDVAEGAEVLRSIVNAGLVPPGATTKQLKSIAAQMADVSHTFGTDMSMQTQAVAAMLKNRLAPDAEAALDVITLGMQKLGPNAEDLLETFQEYSVQLRKLGIDSGEALGLFRQGIQGGARDTDIIADAFKEFSIRAVDMSDTSREAYKALGLDAKAMEQQIGQGGDAAQRGLQTVLDKLRSMKDPVAREAAAVGLFGTQAEDLGSALFKLDPGRAVSVMGKVSGTAKQLGKTLHSGPSHEVEVFVRTLKQGFVNVLGNQVLPIISKGGAYANRYLVPPLKTGGSVIASILVPALLLVVSAGKGTIDWLREFGVWLVPAAIAVGGLTLALNANAIATAFVTGVFSVYRAAILVGTAVTNGFAIAQGLLNAVMALNPFVLVAIALVALGAALVIAYKKSETFRAIVQAAFKAISVAALWLWNVVLKPVVGFAVKAFQWWWTAAKIYFTAVGVIFYTLGAVAVWLWKSAISPVIGWIVGGFRLWWTGAKLYFGLVGAGFRAVGAGAVWLWDVAISPVLDLIVGGFRLWWAGAKLYFGFVRAGFRAVGAGATWLWKNAIAPALNGIRSVIATVYSVGIKPVLAALRTAVGKTGDAFGAAKDAIKIAWDKLKGIARTPVQYVVDVVYNNGIRGVWNKVASAFGAPKLSKYKFARGGPVFGAGTETSDDVPAWLSKNEHVWTAKEVRGAGGHGAVMALRKWAAAGGRGRPGFADGGGLFGWVGSAASTAKGWGSDAWEAVKSGAKWLKDTLADSARSGVNTVVKPLLRGIPHLDSGIGKMIAKVPERMIDALFGYAEKADKKGASESSAGFGGGQIPTGKRATIIRRALQAAGVPPPGTIGQWLAGMNTLITRESGWNASAVNRWDINAKNGVPSQGLAQTIPPTWSAYVPTSLRSRGILDPVGNVAAAIRYIVARYGNITRVQQANANAAPKGYAGGGRPRPGEMFWVGERGPELMQLGAHGATVWDSATSMRMASGLGVLKGFAKGTSGAQTKAAKAQAAVRKEIAGDLTGVTKALTASAADIKKAFDELTKDLRATGVAGKALAASTVAASVKLQALAEQRDSVDARLEAAKSAASDQKKAAADFLGLSQVGEVDTVTDLLGALKSRQATVKTFQQQIAALSKKGLSQDLISQLVAMGPEGALIGLVAGASKGQIGQLNTLAKSGAALSASYGNTMADAMFDAGTQAGRGFLTGLKAQKKELQKEMTSLGGTLVAALEAKLRIKSPAKRTQWTGEMTGLGLQVGLDNTASRVAAAAARVADAAVPETPTVSPVSVAASTPQGLAPGTRLRLVVDGREFNAYVDDRADDRVNAGFTRVRRAASSGRKQ